MFLVTSGQEDFDKLRLIAYDGANVIIICFSLVRKDHFAHVVDTVWMKKWKKVETFWHKLFQWVPEVKKYCPGVPIVLVGTQKDLLDEDKKSDAYAKGVAMARRIKAFKYMECSAKTMVSEILITTTVWSSVSQTMCLKKFQKCHEDSKKIQKPLEIVRFQRKFWTFVSRKKISRRHCVANWSWISVQRFVMF